MSHEIDMTTGKPAMAFVGEKPWHGLGFELKPGATIEEWKTAAGLDWAAVKSPVLYRDLQDQQIEMPNRFVLHRSDTGRALSIVSQKYEVVQPYQVLDFFKQIINKVGGFEMETAGALQDGCKVWALAKSTSNGLLGDTDPVHRYLMLATSYDFSLATVAVQTSIRVVCMNTLRASLSSDESQILRLIHRRQLDEEQLREKLGIDEEWEQYAQAVNKLVGIKVGDAEAKDYFMDLLYPEKVRALPSFSPKAATKAVNRLWCFYKEAPGQSLVTADNTAWGLVNAVTYWIDHNTRARSASNRVTTAWFGDGAQLKSRALKQALALAK